MIGENKYVKDSFLRQIHLSCAASVSAKKSSSAALRANEAHDSGDAKFSVECAVEFLQVALASMETIRQDVERMQVT